MALKGEAKTAYMREYMPRRRAKQATKPAGKPRLERFLARLEETTDRLAEATAVLAGSMHRIQDLQTQLAQLNARAAGLEEERDRYKQMAESGGDQRLQARIAELEAALRQTDRKAMAEREARSEAAKAAAAKRKVEKATAQNAR